MSSVSSLEVFQPLRKLLTGEHIAILQLKNTAQGLAVVQCLVPAESNSGKPVLLTLFDRNGNVNFLARPMLKQRNVEPRATGIPNLRLRISNHCFEIPAILLRFADQLHVVFELGGVVGFREEIFKED